jgi:hypothetical protein
VVGDLRQNQSRRCFPATAPTARAGGSHWRGESERELDAGGGGRAATAGNPGGDLEMSELPSGAGTWENECCRNGPWAVRCATGQSSGLCPSFTRPH